MTNRRYSNKRSKSIEDSVNNIVSIRNKMDRLIRQMQSGDFDNYEMDMRNELDHLLDDVIDLTRLHDSMGFELKVLNNLVGEAQAYQYRR